MRLRLLVPLLLTTFFTLGADPATQPAYLAPDNFDFKALLGDPPEDGSPTQTQEVETLLQLQASRTPEQVQRCQDEVNATAFIFADVLGPEFNAKDLPVTAALMKQVLQQTKVVSGAAKAQWNRKRPYVTDPRIKPCVELEKTPSFPSGHATRGMVWGLILAEIYPEHRDALVARGREFGDDRFMAGIHYPSDVAAGQKLGAEIAKRLLADPEFRAKLDKAKMEASAHAHA
jgi:membrane-associated phospholipid phosphatase